MSEITATGLRTEYQERPLALATGRPRLYWLIKDAREGAVQTGYQIVAGRDGRAVERGEGELWDTGKVLSDEQAHIEYAGAELGSREAVWWSVRLWDMNDRPGAWAAAALFETGLRQPGDWTAKFVAAPLVGTGQLGAPAPMMRRAFNVGGTVTSARLYITALGLYDVTMNGRRVGGDLLRPGWTDYSKRLNYQAYDVTELVVRGANVIATTLGDGWYCGRVGPHDRGVTWGSRPALMAQLEIRHADGSRTVVETDGQWRWNTGPIISNDLIDGERYDARRELDGWDTAGFVCDDWRPVELVDRPEVLIEPAAAPPVRALMEIAPVAMTTPKAPWERAVRIFDFGQNLTGVVRFTLKAPAGTTIVLRHAEVLKPDGTLDTSNLRSARQTDEYTFRGNPAGESYQPRFTLHGFRYVEISASFAAFAGEDGPALNPQPADVRAVVLATDTPDRGTFACDQPLLNQLQSNIRWGMRGNFIEVPTDCPQRDERLGWTGDTQVFASTAAFNAEVAPFYAKWMRDLNDAQVEDGAVPSIVPKIGRHWDKDGESGWSDAVLVVPLETYFAYGDRRILEESYPAQKRWINYLKSTSRDGGIRPAGAHITHKGYGDWLALDGHRTDPFAPNGTPKELIATAHHAEALSKAAMIAGILGRVDDASEYRQRREEVVAAFNREFVATTGRLTAPSQTSYLLALAFDLLPEPLRGAAVGYLLELLELRNWHLTTGFIGTPLLCPVLTRFGRLDVAYRVLLQTTYPGWLYPVTLGATTMWERWNSWHPAQGFVEVGMNSLNHYAYGAIGKWMYSTIAGLDMDRRCPGYKRAIFRPQPGGGVRRASASLLTLRGAFGIKWWVEGGVFTADLLVPPNAQAELFMPDGSVMGVCAGSHTYHCNFKSEQK